MQRKGTDAPPPDDGYSEVVSVVSLPRGSRNVCLIRIIKTCVFLIFFCGLIGAFVYAINSHSPEDEKSEEFNNTLSYSVYRSQCSDKGTYVHTLMGPDHKELSFNGQTFWYQDDDKKFLNYKKDKSTVIWVFETNSFWATVNDDGDTISCREDPSVGYVEYIRQLSLTDMYNRHSERRQMRADTKVYVFDADPTEWKHEKVEPYLVQAFAAADNGRLIEFQSYYTQDLNHGWLSLGYNFTNMKLEKPSEDRLAGLPNTCQPSAAANNNQPTKLF